MLHRPFAAVGPCCEHVGPAPGRSALATTKTTRTRTLAAVVLAAGKGKRLKSARPKVLHPICGKPALWHVLQAALGARPTKLIVVVGHGADDVRAAVERWGISPKPVFVEQTEQLGTGHAVAAAERAIGRVDDVLVLGGDYDPVTREDIATLVRTHRRRKVAATIATAEVDDPGGYGRVLRDGDRLIGIVEHADATPSQREIREVWLLATLFRRADLFRVLPLVGTDNRQHEHYLNDVFPILLDKGEQIAAIRVDTGGAMGLNSRGGLAAVTRVVRRRINDAHMANGVTLLDPDTAYIDVGVSIGRDTTILPNTTIEGDTSIGRDGTIGPNVHIRDARIGDHAIVRFAVVEEATLARHVTVGPFARIRPGTRLADHVIVGSYVEVKNSQIGEDSKVPHLSYVGDATVGKRTNIGAANVTANWDGYTKHHTEIGDDVRTGSDTIMVAPVTIGDGAMTGAGSVISKDVPPGALAVERTEQRNVEGYRKRKDAQHRQGKGRKGA
jgi:bifunctional UDP-N-acetylglucosamine pyrophosphorylase/glucosamine-1-phosphate N-acetyltransferase